MIIAQKFPKFRFFRRLKTIGCGCLIIFILFIILAFIFGGLIIRKLISGTITQQTGIVQTNTDNNGQSFIDPKTGATTSLGINKIPDSFPKDFPVYPGSTITMSRTGSDTKSGGQNFWLTMVTNDGVEKVSTYYQSALVANAWSAVQASTTDNNGSSWVVSKGNLSGYLTVERNSNDKQTSIIVVLGEVSK